MWRLTAASCADRSDSRPWSAALVGGPTRQRHEAAEVAQHGFAEFVGKERRLRLRRIHGCAEERAKR